MKVTLSWLRQYVEFTGSADDLADRLTMLGLEVEGVQRIAGEFEGIVVAQVLTREAHPNADKLSLCRVQDGQGERQIVCGAQNFKAGDKVPLILPGATLPARAGEKPLTIKVGKIRGVESHGMMCSPQELGLPDAVDGLLILRDDARVGQPFAEYLGRTAGEVVFDLEITPNRADLNSVIGIAREIAASTSRPLQLPRVELPTPAPNTPTVDQWAAVRLDAPDLCPRYTARVLRGVRIGPSPDWLRQRLEHVGLRSINNVVDVTNYVMLETGQPLHAFDYHLIGRAESGIPTIIVRRAAPGEQFTTLDGQAHTLSPDALMIADPAKAIALAGVMGGQNTEINERTTDVLLESAWFLPTNVRRTSKTLGLRTDASYRFERGVDLGNTEWASQRAAQLILETAGGELLAGVVDAYPTPVEPRQVTLRHAKANALLGVALRPEEMEYHLGQLGLKITGRKPRPTEAPASAPEPVTFTIPSFRPDLKREIDLIEEIARLHGVDKIPSTPPRGAIGAHAFDAVHDQWAEIRRLLAGLGLHEAQGQTLVPEAAARRIVPDPVLLNNPLSSDMNALRPSLLPGLLDSIRHNVSRQTESVALFELGRVFRHSAGTLHEQRFVALALTGRRTPGFWQGADRDALADIHDLKGLIEECLEHLGLRGVVYTRRDQPTPFFVESATLTLGGKVPLGELGQLQPLLAREYDIRSPVFLAELNVDQLLARRAATRGFKPLPAQPSVRRDVALLVPETVTHAAVLAAVRHAKPAHLESTELFDVFRGKNVSTGHKSVAYAFTYRHADRTLTDTEVNATQDQLVAHLRQALQATIRE